MDAELWFEQVVHGEPGPAAARNLRWGGQQTRTESGQSAALSQHHHRGATLRRTGREHHHGHGDERADRHDDQQGDGDALPVPLGGADVHVLLQRHRERRSAADTQQPTNSSGNIS